MDDLTIKPSCMLPPCCIPGTLLDTTLEDYAIISSTITRSLHFVGFDGIRRITRGATTHDNEVVVQIMALVRSTPTLVNDPPYL
jgi:hypothetical protein